jgi:outer membrane protein
MYRYKPIMVLGILLASLAPVFAQETPPIQPNITLAPLPPAVTLPAPPNRPADVPNRPLTAAEAAMIALRYQSTIAEAQANVTIAQGVTQATRSALYPSLSISAGYNNESGNTIFGGTSGPGYQVTPSLHQLVFDFNHTRELVRQAAAEQRATVADLTAARSNLIFQVKQDFYAYAQAERLVAVNEANVRNAQSQLALAQARLNVGVGLPSDVVTAETAVQEAIFALNTAQNNASLAEVNLALLMGIDPRTPIVAADTGEPPMGANDVQGLVNEAMQRRPEIIAAREIVSAAQHGVSAAKTGNAPSLALTAEYVEQGASPALGNNTLIVGVGLQFTPFDSGLTAGRVKQAKGTLTSTQAQLNATILSVVSDVSQAYLNIKNAKQGVVTAQAEKANAEEEVRLAEGRYRAGLGVFLDIITAQTALVTANTNLVNAQTAVDQARAALAHAVNIEPEVNPTPAK